MVKMNSLIVNKVNYKNMSQCWGCRKIGESDKFCSLHSNLFSHSICMECYNNNIENKLKECINCAGSFLLDYTKLKENDIIKYGFDEFMFCYNCLSKKNKKCIGYYGMLDDLEKEDYEYFDTWSEEWITPTFKNINESIIRIIGKTVYNFNEEKNNITKKIYNCINNDTRNFKIKGDIIYENIYELLQIQNYKCYICNELVLTTGYKPYCCNQFSIDRLDNKKPHNKDNVKISCYFCNCKHHYLYKNKEKICNIDDCKCKNLLN
jgi:hypothetical protein